MAEKPNRERKKEFRKIKSLDFLFEVNEDGTVLRNVKSKRKIKIQLDMHHSSYGYYVAFVNIKGKKKRVMLHQVVAECWLGDKPKDYEIDHIDRSAHNNHYSNLRYVTRSEQMKNRVLSQRIIDQATKNCLEHCLKYIAKPVVLTKKNQEQKFRSMTKAAEYIAKEYGVNSECVRSKFKQRRKKIYDYDITYPCAEAKK